MTTDFAFLEPGTEAPSLRDEPAALRTLMDALAQRPDFPSLGEALSAVRRVARSEMARLQNLSEALLQDVGLTHRVLRLANSAHYRPAGAGQISTLSRAVAVLGFVEVNQLALTSKLIDVMQDRARSLPLREEFLRGLLAGTVAHELSHREAEEGYLVALFRNLGRLVAFLHLESQALSVRRAVPRSSWPLSEAEDRAAQAVLGVDYGALGLAVARRWGWPDAFRESLRHGVEPPRQPSRSRTEQSRAMGWLANEMADLLLYVAPQERRAGLETLAQRFGAVTAHSADSLQAALARARPRLERLAELLQLPLSQQAQWGGTPDLCATPPEAGAKAPMASPSVAQSVAPGRAAPPPGGEAAGVATSDDADEGAGGRSDDPLAVDEVDAAEGDGSDHEAAPPRGSLRLLQGLHTVMEALASGDAAQAHTAVLRTLLQGLGAQRAVLCLRDGPRGDLVGRFGLGQGAAASHEQFRVPLNDPHDLFSLLCARGADTLISDARDPAVAQRLPRWWRTGVGSRSFLVLPLMHERQPVGMLYADRPEAQGLVIDGDAMQLVRTLRNQSLIAWRQGA